MIGATALLHHLAIGRTTADIDLVLVAEVDAIGPLLEPLGWHRDQRQLQRWRNGDGVIADVLPGSANLIATGKVVFEQGFEMSLVGFDLLLATALTVTLPGTQFSLEVASLPALAVLKMVAWLDRPDRTKDLGDMARILASSLPPDDDRRFDPDSPLFAINFDEQPAFFIGSEIARVASTRHLELVDRFLAKLHPDHGTAFLQMLMASRLAGDSTEERLSRWLNAFAVGFAHTA